MHSPLDLTPVERALLGHLLGGMTTYGAARREGLRAGTASTRLMRCRQRNEADTVLQMAAALALEGAKATDQKEVPAGTYANG